MAEAEVLADLGLQLFLHPAFRFIAGIAAGRQLVPAYCPLHPSNPKKDQLNGQPEGLETPRREQTGILSPCHSRLFIRRDFSFSGEDASRRVQTGCR